MTASFLFQKNAENFSAITHLMDALRQKQLNWLDKVIAVTGMKQTQLAVKANMDPSALSKFRSGATQHLRERNINRLSAASGVAPPDSVQTGMEEGEAVFFDMRYAPQLSPPDANNPQQFAMQLTSKALNKLGFDDGDILIFDTDRTPNSGDIVCAQIIDPRLGDATTVIREFERPYLIAPDAVSGPRILIVDDEHVQIRGVLARHIRVITYERRRA